VQPGDFFQPALAGGGSKPLGAGQKPGFWARLSKGAGAARCGKTNPRTGGARVRLAAKPTEITSKARPAAQARTLMRAARRPEASKKIGLLAIVS